MFNVTKFNFIVNSQYSTAQKKKNTVRKKTQNFLCRNKKQLNSFGNIFSDHSSKINNSNKRDLKTKTSVKKNMKNKLDKKFDKNKFIQDQLKMFKNLRNKNIIGNNPNTKSTDKKTNLCSTKSNHKLSDSDYEVDDDLYIPVDIDKNFNINKESREKNGLKNNQSDEYNIYNENRSKIIHNVTNNLINNIYVNNKEIEKAN